MDNFDTSNYKLDNIHGICPNQFIVGKFKDYSSLNLKQ